MDINSRLAWMAGPGVFAVLFLMLSVLAGYFVWKSGDDLGTILAEVRKTPALITKTVLQSEERSLAPQAEKELRFAVALEQDVIALRNQRSVALLATRTWMRFLSLLSGTILCVVGAAFVLGRVNAPASSGEVEVLGQIKMAFVSSSPGLVLAFLGTILIALPNLAGQMIEVSDKAAYFVFEGGGAASSPVSSEAPGLAEAWKDYQKANPASK